MQVPVAERGTPFHQEKGDWRSMMNHVMAGHGAIACDEEAPLQRALKLDEGPLPQVKLDDPAAGSVREIEWTPNRVEVEVDLTQRGTVLFNQNWNEHWKTTAGTLVKFGPKWQRDVDGGRLAVDAPPGKYRFAVYYRPRSFVIGAVTSLFLPLLMALFVIVRRKSRTSDNSGPRGAAPGTDEQPR
jgi:DNA-directed RNA polymerase subunit H (RpoH/RPB5)